jgi:hypothetical protein
MGMQSVHPPSRAGVTGIADKLLSQCPVVVTGLLILARAILASLGLPAPTVVEILAATHVSRSTAYETHDVLVELLPTLIRARGRPAKPPPAATDQGAALTRAVLGYVTHHAGCVQRGPVRQHYSDGFRRFIVELRAEHAALDVEPFASAVDVPLGTLKDWLRDPIAAAVSSESEPSPPPDADSAQMQTVLDAWTRWDGTFIGFCDHVRAGLLVPFGREAVARILHVHGLRRPAHRKGRTPDESALRGSFRTFFPGAQWVGDGMQVPVVIDGQRFTFNFELDVDAYTGAFTGACVRPEEDAAAVVEAFQDGVITTGQPPLALLLDNRPSNHTPEVDLALGDTLRIRATPARPQNKAHVEGAFGLFSQVLPDLVLDTRTGPLALAGAFVSIVVQLWARTTNHRPRADRGGRSRVDLYAEQPSDEQIAQARCELQETVERLERARLTRQARCRPGVLDLLDSHFARLGLLDPQRSVRIAIAGHSLHAILAGISIFDAKLTAKTLPDGVDARYLLGIVKNVDAQTEGEAFARSLYDLRIEMRDRMLAAMVADRDAVVANSDVNHVIAECVDRALETDSPLRRTFWLDSLADVLRSREDAVRRALFLAAAHRIEATFSITPRERHDAVRVLADCVAVIP